MRIGCTASKRVSPNFSFMRRLKLSVRLAARPLPWFWFFFTVAVLLLSALVRYHIVSQFKQRERVVIIDPAGGPTPPTPATPTPHP
jgi:hypothetical protein